jgi:exocyst complex protein 7
VSGNNVLSYLSDDGFCAAGDPASRKTIREKIKISICPFKRFTEFRQHGLSRITNFTMMSGIQYHWNLKVIQAYTTFR